MVYFIQFIDYLLWLYIVIVFIWAIMSWLIAFNVVNTYNPVVRAIVDRGHTPMDDNEADALALLAWAIANDIGGAQ